MDNYAERNLRQKMCIHFWELLWRDTQHALIHALLTTKLKAGLHTSLWFTGKGHQSTGRQVDYSSACPTLGLLRRIWSTFYFFFPKVACESRVLNPTLGTYMCTVVSLLISFVTIEEYDIFWQLIPLEVKLLVLLVISVYSRLFILLPQICV